MYVRAKKEFKNKTKNKLTWKIYWFSRNFGLYLGEMSFYLDIKKHLVKPSDYCT